MHPGWVDTPGVQTYLPKFRGLTLPFMRTPEQGADTQSWLVATQQVHPWTGGFWHDRALRPTHHFRRTRETAPERQQLWDYCTQATSAA